MLGSPPELAKGEPNTRVSRHLCSSRVWDPHLFKDLPKITIPAFTNNYTHTHIHGDTLTLFVDQTWQLEIPQKLKFIGNILELIFWDLRLMTPQRGYAAATSLASWCHPMGCRLSLAPYLDDSSRATARDWRIGMFMCPSFSACIQSDPQKKKLDAKHQWHIPSTFIEQISWNAWASRSGSSFLLQIGGASTLGQRWQGTVGKNYLQQWCLLQYMLIRSN